MNLTSFQTTQGIRHIKFSSDFWLGLQQEIHKEIIELFEKQSEERIVNLMQTRGDLHLSFVSRIFNFFLNFFLELFFVWCFSYDVFYMIDVKLVDPTWTEHIHNVVIPAQLASSSSALGLTASKLFLRSVWDSKNIYIFFNFFFHPVSGLKKENYPTHQLRHMVIIARYRANYSNRRAYVGCFMIKKGAKGVYIFFFSKHFSLISQETSWIPYRRRNS